jgi:biopolymer transport protein ExbD
MKLKTDKKRSAKIEIIPMIDVMFFLLIFFMVLSSQNTKEKKLPLRLAEAQNGLSSSEKALFVNIEANKKITFKDVPLDLDDLGSALVQAMGAEPQQTLVIRADKNTVVSLVVAVMDRAKKVGVNKFALATK